MSDFIELKEPSNNSYGYFIQAQQAPTMMDTFYLSIDGKIESDVMVDPFKSFYWDTLELAWTAASMYYFSNGKQYPWAYNENDNELVALSPELLAKIDKAAEDNGWKTGSRELELE